MTTLPILYSFRRCPYAMRARMAIAVSGVQVELREVVLRDKPAEMIEVSPKGTVPVLILPGGMALDESLDIMHWALGQHDPENWLSQIDGAVITANDGPFKHALDRYKYPHRYELEGGLAHRDLALTHLAGFDQRLGATAYLSGNQCGFTDIALFPFVRQFAATDPTWFAGQPMPTLQRWLADLTESDLFARIMLRYPQWKTGNAPTYFP